MKKTFGILSVLLALTIAVNAVTPAMSVTLQNVFSQKPQTASLNDSFIDSSEDYTVTDGQTANGKASTQKEVAYENGKILIVRPDEGRIV